MMERLKIVSKQKECKQAFKIPSVNIHLPTKLPLINFSSPVCHRALFNCGNPYLNASHNRAEAAHENEPHSLCLAVTVGDLIVKHQRN